MTVDRLTDAAIRKARATSKARKLGDGHGLFLTLRPDGARYWRFKYRFAGKEKQLSFGVYPAVSIASARTQRAEARALLDQGIDPSAARREAKWAATAAEAQTETSPRVVLIDGAVEVWCGKTALRLSAIQARAVRDLLNQLVG
jgi:hypothetical protein